MLHKFFLTCFRFIARHQICTVLCCTAAVGFAVYSYRTLTLEEDIINFLPADNPAINDYKKVFTHFKLLDKMFIVITKNNAHTAETGTAAEDDVYMLMDYADDLAEKLSASCGRFIEQLFYRFSEAQYTEILSVMARALPVLADPKDYKILEQHFTTESLKSRIDASYKILASPAGSGYADIFSADPLSAAGIVMKKLEDLKLDSSMEYVDGFLFTKDKKNLIMVLTPALSTSETGNNEIFFTKVSDDITSLRRTYPDVAAYTWGTIPAALENARVMKKDIFLAVCISMAVIGALIFTQFNRKLHAVYIFLPIVFGGLTAFGVAGLIYSSISAIALGMASVLIGVSVDQGIHLVTHYEKKSNSEETVRLLSTPIISSAATTAGAFFCLLFVSIPGLRQMGVISGISILAAAVFSLLFLPHFFQKPAENRSSGIVQRIASFPYHLRKPLLILYIIVFGSAVFNLPRIRFDGDINNLGYISESMRFTQDQVMKIWSSGVSRMMALTAAPDYDTAAAKAREVSRILASLKEEGKVELINGPAGLLYSRQEQDERIQNWNKFWTKSRKTRCRNAVMEKSQSLGISVGIFENYFKALDNPGYLDFDTMPVGLRHDILSDYVKFINDTWLVLTVYKAAPEYKEEVQNAVKTVPGIITVSKQDLSQSILTLIYADFIRLTQLAVLAVFVILVITFKNLFKGFVCLLPVALSWVITIGIMPLFGIQFNMVNIIISVFIFGIGIDYSIFLLRGIEHDIVNNSPAARTSEGTTVNSYKLSILLSGITTVCGLGVLAFAAHPVLKSIGITALIGLGTVLYTVLVIQPVIVLRAAKSRFFKTFTGK